MSLTSAFHRPPLHLAPYVAYFFSLEAPACGAGDSAHAVQVLPVPHMQLVFSFGDESFERTMDGPVVRSPGFAVTGYTTRTVEYLNGGRLGVLMAGLQPWGFRALLARALPPVLDRNIELRALFGGVDELETSLRGAASGEERLRLVEAFLTRNLRAPAVDDVIERTVERITTARGNIPVQALALQAGLSALTAGYYDQSHFINAFRAFTGLTPAEYLRCLTRSEPGLTFDAHVRPDDPMRRMYV